MTRSHLEKPLTYAAAGALLLAVLAPVRQSWRPRRDRKDGFPLSYYPMFSARRHETGTVVHLMATDSDGYALMLHYRHAGTGGLNQVRRQIRRRVHEGAAAGLATTAATSVRASRRHEDRELVQVLVVSSEHHYDTFFAGDPTPVHRRVHAIAPVHPHRGD